MVLVIRSRISEMLEKGGHVALDSVLIDDDLLQELAARTPKLVE